jgi:hypothetical protein
MWTSVNLWPEGLHGGEEDRPKLAGEEGGEAEVRDDLAGAV